jgi:protein-glutamine gamma-glutamyltransferase
VQNWLLSEFRYTLDLPASPREATLEHFLFRRRAGHCEYFSTALAILLREAGVPTRNVNGFLGGAWNEFGRFMTVSQNEAHSWVEVYFPGYGWVPFDATPAATTDVARQQQDNWLSPFRSVADGLEHRWNKWILEYNLETQVGLFRRATEQFARRDSTGRMKMNPGFIRVLKYAVGGVVFLLILAMIFRRSRSEDLAVESRLYLKLRRAYEKAGYDVRPQDAPMRFIARLRETNAPGVDAAERAVVLYLRSRFGGEDIGGEGKQDLRDAVEEALRDLRTAPRRAKLAA